MMRRLGILGLAVVLVVLGTAGCREKTPYPKVVAPGSVPEPDPVPSTVLGGTPAAGDPGAAPTESGPSRPWLLVATPEGSFLVGGRPGGADLTVRRHAGVLRVADDGAVRGLLARTRDIPGSKSARTSNLALLEPVGFGGAAVRAGTVVAEDVTAAFEADPDMAAQFHHQESLTALGVRGSVSTWLASVTGYLGGAHPYASRTLLIVDLETGRVVPADPAFAGRDLAAEVLGARAAEACVRRPAGAAPVEGLGGEPAWLAGFTHEFESCAGDFVGARVSPPAGTPAPVPVAGMSFAGGTLALEGAGLSLAGVADWRVAPDARAAVVLMARDRRDEPPLPWSAERTGRRRAPTRELRAWEAGMAQPVVIGRASAILAAQFLDGRPDGDRIVQAFEGL